MREGCREGNAPLALFRNKESKLLVSAGGLGETLFRPLANLKNSDQLFHVEKLQLSKVWGARGREKEQPANPWEPEG